MKAEMRKKERKGRFKGNLGTGTGGKMQRGKIKAKKVCTVNPAL
jgi:hypothetical protein